MKNIYVALLMLVLVSFSSSGLARNLTMQETVLVEEAGDRIGSLLEERSLSVDVFSSLVEIFIQERELTEQKILLLLSLKEYVIDTYGSNGELLPRSIQEMKQKIFVGSGLVFEEVLNTTSFYTRYRISYMSNGLSISGIMNIPVGDGPFPLVLLNHGYIDPRVYTVGRGLKREQDYLARNGYVVLHTDYRNHGLSDSSGDLIDNYYFRSYFYGTDSINAINAVAALGDPKIDATKVAMMGHSMGGGVTMHSIIAQPNLIDAAILYAPVHTRERENFERWRREDLSQQELEILVQKIGPIDQDSSFAPYSPDSYLDEIVIPLQYYHGTNDADVPYDRSVETVQKLQESNANVELIAFEGEGHEFGFRWNDFMEGVVEFLDIHMR